MTYRISTKDFQIEYKNSSIDNTVIMGNHCHSQFELIGVLEGEILISYEDKKFQVASNQFVILPPFGFHTILSNKNGCYKRITATFDSTAIPQEIRPFFTNTSDVVTSSSVHIESIKNLCKKSDSALYAPLIQALMTMIFYDNVSILTSKQGTYEYEQNEILQRIISYIDRHLYEKIRLDDIANQISYSKATIQNIFKKELNTSPKQYIISKKIMLANRLILDGMSPTEAAKKLGYENYSDFYRIYVKYTQRSPSEDKGRKSIR